MKRWHCIYYFHNLVCISFAMIQLLAPLYNGYKTHSRILPLVDCYPFNIYVTPVYHFMYLYQCCILMALIMQHVNWDQFLIGLFFFASSECDVLCDRLRNLKITDGEDMKDYDAKLIGCIKHHRKIRR